PARASLGRRPGGRPRGSSTGRMTLMRRTFVAALAALALGGATPLAAQYFGQNKVQYRTFDFKVIQTEHFEVYFYDQERAAALEHVMQHEMVHQFQYDVFSHGRAGAGVGTIISVNPPLWFMEGMAEYLSIGPIDPHTAMWLRDASLEGHLPTIEQLTYDPRIF